MLLLQFILELQFFFVLEALQFFNDRLLRQFFTLVRGLLYLAVTAFGNFVCLRLFPQAHLLHLLSLLLQVFDQVLLHLASFDLLFELFDLLKLALYFGAVRACIIVNSVKPQISWLALTSLDACLCHVIAKHELVVNMLRHCLQLTFIEVVGLASVFINLRCRNKRECVAVPNHEIASAADEAKRIDWLRELDLAQKHLLVGPDFDQSR